MEDTYTLLFAISVVMNLVSVIFSYISHQSNQDVIEYLEKVFNAVQKGVNS